MEKEYLDSKKISYEEVFVDENPKKAQEMLEMSGQMGVPFTVIETESGQKVNILGFDKTKINKTLNLS